MPPRSKIKQLPKAVLAWLEKTLEEGNFSGYEQLAAELKARGYDISKSAIHRYGHGVIEARIAAVRASTDAARMIADAAPDDSDQRSAAVVSMVQSELFAILLTLQEAEGAKPEDRLKLMSRAASSIAELSRASVNLKKFQSDVQAKIAAKMNAMEGEAKSGKGRFDLETLRRVREELYGIVG